MTVFRNCSVVLVLKDLPFKEKNRLKLAIIENGGVVSYVVNKQCSFIVTNSLSSLSSSRLRCIQKHHTPVVELDYVTQCLAKGVRLPVEEYSLAAPAPTCHLATPSSASGSQGPDMKISVSNPFERQSKVEKPTDKTVDQSNPIHYDKEPYTTGEVIRVCTEEDHTFPTFPASFQVAKYCIVIKDQSRRWSVLELQSGRCEGGQQYRVVHLWREDSSKSSAPKNEVVLASTSEKAIEVYQKLRKELQAQGLTLSSSLPADAQGLVSSSLQQLLLEEKLNCGALTQEVGVFVELLWKEALGCLDSVLKVPVENLSLNDVSRAEGLLLQAQRLLRKDKNSELTPLMEEVYSLLPHRLACPPVDAKLISQKLDLCQLVRDILNVSELTLRNPVPSCMGKYRALRCGIDSVPSGTPEFQAVSDLLHDRKVQIQQVLRVGRGVELQMFKEELGHVRPLLHSSRPSSFVGILSRGLLLPRVGVEHHGIERTDIGNLGSGIYFSDSMSTSLKYSKPIETDGSRLLLVCDVALGKCRDVHRRDASLSQAPEGYQSVHGVRRTPRALSDFEDDEYVVYSPDQVKLKYVVQFSVEEDQLKEFSPAIDTSSELPQPRSSMALDTNEEDLGTCKNPLDDVKAGLLDSAGQPLPLQAVHAKCKLMDLLSQVIIFQKYANRSSTPIEAKYVFPLNESAAVCGFEAFINGKHVVGKVKEKEQARKEYKQAIQKGHGAYLMDQDAPDVFTISVGNLPPDATVLIKITFVTELVIRDGTVLFSLPGSVAPWQQSAALNQTTQATVEKVCVTDVSTQGEFSLDMSVEMPYEILDLRCVTHKVKTKQTACKAVVSVLPGQTMGSDGFELSFTLTMSHLPRMWVEKHPDKDSQACMLVFYPRFNVHPDVDFSSNEVILLLDTSESMIGEALQDARRVALQVLKGLDPSLRVNVISFGTDYSEALLSAQPISEAVQLIKKFISTFPPVGGSTDLWRVLRSLSLLPPSRGVRNLLLLSDGHIQNQSLTLQLVRDSSQHSRLFSCGLSPTANRHMLRALSQAGGGSYEFFDTKTKHTWAEKVATQVKCMASPGCSSVSVKWQQFNPGAPSPVQAPAQLTALFSNCHNLVYGFVPHCTQATLFGDLGGQEIQTMVSTSELQKTKGTFLHKLTARAIIRDYEDGSLASDEVEHEEKKSELKSYIIELSKEFSILSQYTSFVAIEERDPHHQEVGFTDVAALIELEDIDFLPYLSWKEEEQLEEEGNYEESAILCQCLCLETDSLEENEEREVLEGNSVMEMEMFSLHSGKLEPHKKQSLTVPYLGSHMLNHSLSSPLSSPCPPPSSQPSPPPPPCPLTPRPMSFRKAMPHLAIAYSGWVQPQSVTREPQELSDIRNFRISHGHDINMDDYAEAARTHTSVKQVPLSNQGFTFGHQASASATAFGASSPPVGFELHVGMKEVAQCGPAISGDDLTVPQAFRGSYVPNSYQPHLANMGSHQPGLTTTRDLQMGRPARLSLPLYSTICHSKRSDPINVEVYKSNQVGGFDGPRMSSSRVTEPVVMSCRRAVRVDPPELEPELTKAFNVSLPLDLGFRSDISSLSTSGNGWGSNSTTPRQMHGFFGLVPKSYKTFACSGPAGATPTVFGTSSLPVGTQHYPKMKRGPSVLIPTPVQYSPPTARPPFGGSFAAETCTDDFAENATPMFLRHHGSQAPRPPRAVWSNVREHSTSLDFRKISLDQVQIQWTQIFGMQHSEGYWECTESLGVLLGLDVDLFANVFLKGKGICSLGARAHADILKLVATLLVLQLVRVKKLEEGKLLLSLFRLEDAPHPRSDRWEALKKSVDWVRGADRQYPCVCSRLEFGWDWESSTRQLLGVDTPRAVYSLSTTGQT